MKKPHIVVWDVLAILVVLFCVAVFSMEAEGTLPLFKDVMGEALPFFPQKK